MKDLKHKREEEKAKKFLSKSQRKTERQTEGNSNWRKKLTPLRKKSNVYSTQRKNNI